MSGGERPIGAAKGKQSDTEALCHPPPPPPAPPPSGVLRQQQDRAAADQVSSASTRPCPCGGPWPLPWAAAAGPRPCGLPLPRPFPPPPLRQGAELFVWSDGQVLPPADPTGQDVASRAPTVPDDADDEGAGLSGTWDLEIFPAARKPPGQPDRMALRVWLAVDGDGVVSGGPAAEAYDAGRARTRRAPAAAAAPEYHYFELKKRRSFPESTGCLFTVGRGATLCISVWLRGTPDCPPWAGLLSKQLEPMKISELVTLANEQEVGVSPPRDGDPPKAKKKGKSKPPPKRKRNKRRASDVPQTPDARATDAENQEYLRSGWTLGLNGGSPGTVRFEVGLTRGSTATATHPKVVLDGEWHRVEVVVAEAPDEDGAPAWTVTLAVDGEEGPRGEGPPLRGLTLNALAVPLTLGADPFGSDRVFDGELQDVRVQSQCDGPAGPARPVPKAKPRAAKWRERRDSGGLTLEDELRRDCREFRRAKWRERRDSDDYGPAYDQLTEDWFGIDDADTVRDLLGAPAPSADTQPPPPRAPGDGGDPPDGALDIQGSLTGPALALTLHNGTDALRLEGAVAGASRVAGTWRGGPPGTSGQFRATRRYDGIVAGVWGLETWALVEGCMAWRLCGYVWLTVFPCDTDGRLRVSGTALYGPDFDEGGPRARLDGALTADALELRWSSHARWDGWQLVGSVAGGGRLRGRWQTAAGADAGAWRARRTAQHGLVAAQKLRGAAGLWDPLRGALGIAEANFGTTVFPQLAPASGRWFWEVKVHRLGVRPAIGWAQDSGAGPRVDTTGAPCCPRGHGLGRVPLKGHTCAVCETTFRRAKRGVTKLELYGCRRCGWYVCPPCVGARWQCLCQAPLAEGRDLEGFARDFKPVKKAWKVVACTLCGGEHARGGAYTCHNCFVYVCGPCYHRENHDKCCLFDGASGRRVHRDVQQDYGAPLEAGDVVGVVLDADARTAAYLVNGVPLGTAFTAAELGRGGLRPAVALGHFGDVTVNFGGAPFCYPPIETGVRGLGEAMWLRCGGARCARARLRGSGAETAGAAGGGVPH